MTWFTVCVILLNQFTKFAHIHTRIGLNVALHNVCKWICVLEVCNDPLSNSFKYQSPRISTLYRWMKFIIPKDKKWSWQWLYQATCRCQHEDLTEVYKLLHIYYNFDWSEYFTLSSVHNARHHVKFFYQHKRHNSRDAI